MVTELNGNHTNELQKRLMGGLVYGVVSGMIVGLMAGLYQCIKHLVLRWLLYYGGNTPFNLARFLNYCHERIFLRKVGGGYIFIHRMLMEHFASLTDDDIERIARSVEERKA
ncbi:MAG: hypothetical protein R3A44_11705 [Caldilineaceae bacterium]